MVDLDPIHFFVAKLRLTIFLAEFWPAFFLLNWEFYP